MKPNKLNIRGIPYTITYCKDILDVEPSKRDFLFRNYLIKVEA